MKRPVPFRDVGHRCSTHMCRSGAAHPDGIPSSQGSNSSSVIAGGRPSTGLPVRGSSRSRWTVAGWSSRFAVAFQPTATPTCTSRAPGSEPTEGPAVWRGRLERCQSWPDGHLASARGGTRTPDILIQSVSRPSGWYRRQPPPVTFVPSGRLRRARRTSRCACTLSGAHRVGWMVSVPGGHCRRRTRRWGLRSPSALEAQVLMVAAGWGRWRERLVATVDVRRGRGRPEGSAPGLRSDEGLYRPVTTR